MSEASPRVKLYSGKDGLEIAADEFGPQDGAAVLLLHGGGQTRRSWKNGGMRLAEAGYRVTAIDARGHGDSGWAKDGDYTLGSLTDDVRSVITQLGPRPAVIGASMGGMTALAMLGEASPPEVRALALVDIAPRFSSEGAERIMAFMRGNPDGFASLEEVADAVSAYNHHRPRPKDISGLRRNLREENGRLYWHWDPAFMSVRIHERRTMTEILEDAARKVTVPTLLVRGGMSDLVREEDVRDFLDLMPNARYVNVSGAGHMVAGDRNDAFNDAIVSFLQTVDSRA